MRYKYLIEYPFDQKDLQYIKHSYPLYKFYGRGMCNGICMEYTRRFMVNESVDVFRSNLYNTTSFVRYHFLKSISLYQPNLQIKDIIQTYDINVNIDYNSDIPFIDGFPEKIRNLPLIGINWRFDDRPNSHIILMKNYQFRNKTLYTFFDPNLGETFPFYKTAMNSAFKQLIEIRYPTALNFSVTNVMSVVEEYIINKTWDKVYMPSLRDGDPPIRKIILGDFIPDNYKVIR